MTQGDIHNTKLRIRRTKAKIDRNQNISERDKDLLVHGTREVPSFLTHLRQQYMSDTRINRYLNTWNRLSEHKDWDIEEVTKPRLAELAGKLANDDIRKEDGGAYAPETKREWKKGIRKMYTDFVEE